MRFFSIDLRVDLQKCVYNTITSCYQHFIQYIEMTLNSLRYINGYLNRYIKFQNIWFNMTTYKISEFCATTKTCKIYSKYYLHVLLCVKAFHKTSTISEI